MFLVTDTGSTTSVPAQIHPLTAGRWRGPTAVPYHTTSVFPALSWRRLRWHHALAWVKQSALAWACTWRDGGPLVRYCISSANRWWWWRWCFSTWLSVQLLTLEEHRTRRLACQVTWWHQRDLDRWYWKCRSWRSWLHAVSVERWGPYADLWTGKRRCLAMCSLSMASRTCSTTFGTQLRFEIGRYDLG